MITNRSFFLGTVVGGLVAAGVMMVFNPGISPIADTESVGTGSGPLPANSPPNTEVSNSSLAPTVDSVDQVAQPGSSASQQANRYKETLTTSSAELPERRTTPTNLVQPIPVPEELRSVLEEAPLPDAPVSMKEAHRIVSSQLKDDQWAWRMEQSFLEFFANHELGAFVDLWLVECRTSYCEIQLASYGGNAENNVKTLTRDMKSHPQIGGYTSQWSSSSENYGLLYFALILNWNNLDQ